MIKDRYKRKNVNSKKTKNSNNFKQFDVVFYDKVHNNEILLHSKKGIDYPLKINFKRNNEGYFSSKHIKTRPAIILQKFTKNRFLIVPLTSKIDLNKKFQNLFRTHFKLLDYSKNNHKENDIQKSYLQWDQVVVVTFAELNGLFRKKLPNGKYSIVNMPESARRFLIKNFHSKSIDFLNYNLKK